MILMVTQRKFFARLYSQICGRSEVQMITLFNKKKLRKLAPLMGKLLTKFQVPKSSIRGTKK
jgi:hypothetical protein